MTAWGLAAGPPPAGNNDDHGKEDEEAASISFPSDVSVQFWGTEMGSVHVWANSVEPFPGTGTGTYGCPQALSWSQWQPTGQA